MKTQTISYQAKSCDTKLKVYYHENTFWLTLENISKLFGSDIKKVYNTLKEMLNSGSLNESKVNQHIEITSHSGKKYLANFYNMDIIMAIGYRLNAKETTQFRIWSMDVIMDRQYSMIDALKRKLYNLF